MPNRSSSLYVVFEHASTIESEEQWLKNILADVHTASAFCTANELVNRNRITSDKQKMLKESAHFRLRPFRFFINKN